jgi:hypothetical protein
MADTDIDAVRKQKKAEYNKQYRLKRKLLLQAFTSTETELAEKQNVLLLCMSVIFFNVLHV